MKKLSLVIVALALSLTSALAFSATPPTIVDLFLAAAKYEKCGTDVIRYAANAVRTNSNRNVTERIIDKANGYIKIQFGAEEDTRTVESCYWKMNNGKLLLAVSHIECQEMTTNLHFYEYDKTTRKLSPIKQPFTLGLGNKAAEVSYSLPRRGKTIKACTYDLLTTDNEPYRWEISWDGSAFVVNHIY